MEAAAMEQVLTCPISLETFVDPIAVPCCGRSFSRGPFCDWWSDHHQCPLCNHDLTAGFNPYTVVRNRSLQDFVDTLDHDTAMPGVPPALLPDWEISLAMLDHPERITQLKIRCHNPKIIPQDKILLILCLDASGSMAGAPTTQIKFFLESTMSMASSFPNVVLKTVSFDTAARFDITAHTYGPGGGTDFCAGLRGITHILKEHPTIKTAHVIFMTDGQDGSGLTPAILTQNFKTDMRTHWSQRTITLHTVGFGNEHNFALLDLLRQAGTKAGSYRFANPQDNQDSLYSTLAALIKPLLHENHTPIIVELPHMTVPVHLSNQKDQVWIPLPAIPANGLLPVTVMGTPVMAVVRQTCNVDLWTLWCSELTDKLIADVLVLDTTRSSCTNPDDVDLFLTLLELRARAILSKLQKYTSDGAERIEDPGPIMAKVETVLATLTSLRSGTVVDRRALTDLKFSSKFGAGPAAPTQAQKPLLPKMPAAPFLVKQVKSKTTHTFAEYHWRRCYRSYFSQATTAAQAALVAPTAATATASQAATGLGQHATPVWVTAEQRAFAQVGHGKPTDAAMPEVYDDKKNTLLHLAARAGKHGWVVRLPSHAHPNAYGETPLDLAILFGWFKIAQYLWEQGMRPVIAGQALLLSCINKERYKTAEWLLLRNVAMVTAEICERVNSGAGTVWATDRIDFSPAAALALGLQKGILTQIRAGWESITAPLRFTEHRHLIEQGHVDCVEALLQGGKMSVLEEWVVDTKDGDQDTRTPLILAASYGQLALCEVFLEFLVQQQPLEEAVNHQTRLKSTALSVAVSRQHIDVITFLLDQGADPNVVDMVGNPPLLNACHIGNVNVVRLLLNAGADMDVHEPDHDTAFLCAIRAGHAGVVEALIHHTPDFDRAALFARSNPIDGFPPVLAAAELNHAAVIKVLHQYGADLEIRTDAANQILAGATAVHLTAFYGRSKAFAMLESLGAHCDSKTDPGLQTPLHIAVEKHQADMVALLLAKEVSRSEKDAQGHTPLYYAQAPQNEYILERFFQNPIVRPLVRLITAKERDKAPGCLILRQYAVSVGCYDATQVTHAECGLGLSALSLAILNREPMLVETFQALGASLTWPDPGGMCPQFWQEIQTKQMTPETARVFQAMEAHMQEALLLRPDRLQSPQQALPGVPNILEMMNSGYQCTKAIVPALSALGVTLQKHVLLLSFVEKAAKVVPNLEPLLWEFSIHALRLLAQNQAAPMSVVQLLSLFLCTGDTTVYEHANKELYEWNRSGIWHPFVTCLTQGLRHLPVFEGECFRRVTGILPQPIWDIGFTIQWPTFVHTTRDWSLISDNGQNKGICFIIQSRTGRLLGPYERCLQNQSVVFLPGSQFKVMGYYKFHAVAFGQANIRERSFTATATELEKAQHGQRNIIVALQEVCEMDALN